MRQKENKLIRLASVSRFGQGLTSGNRS